MTYIVTDDGIHHFTYANRFGVERSQRCGCFCCCEIFPAAEVTDYVGAPQRAQCPRCQIDSVLPDAWIELSTELLIALERRWFGLRKEP